MNNLKGDNVSCRNFTVFAISEFMNHYIKICIDHPGRVDEYTLTKRKLSTAAVTNEIGDLPHSLSARTLLTQTGVRCVRCVDTVDSVFVTRLLLLTQVDVFTSPAEPTERTVTEE